MNNQNNTPIPPNEKHKRELVYLEIARMEYELYASAINEATPIMKALRAELLRRQVEMDKCLRNSALPTGQPSDYERSLYETVTTKRK